MAAENPSPTVEPVKTIYLEDDELVNPPYLERYLGGSALNLSDSNAKRFSAHVGEFLMHEDRFDLDSRLSAQLLLSPGVQVVVGGVFKGVLGQKIWNPSQPAHKIEMNYGWLAVWSNATVLDQQVWVKTKQGEFFADRAIFWVNVKNEQTEIYVVSGNVKDPSGKTWKAGQYVLFSGNKTGASRSWNVQAFRVRIAGAYPNWIKLVEQSDEYWKSGKVRKKMLELREQGWKKFKRKAG